ncbi:hypothetical protein EJ682_23095 [Salmonella enterica]|nr:hypothetical protein [Salmonella enterica]
MVSDVKELTLSKVFQEHIIVYSPDWSEGEGIAALSSEKDSDGNNVSTVVTVHELHDFLSIVNIQRPGFIVMNIEPRAHVSLICYLRKRFEALPIIFTRKRFLFADRMVAEFYGFIWLLQYDALFSGYPNTCLTQWVTDNRFSGTSAGGGVARNQIPCKTLEDWLKFRLVHLTGSHSVTDIAMNWLIHGYSVSEISRAVSRSDKLIYHYRWRIMRSLNIRNYAMDFIPSLSFSGRGPPISAYRASQCQPTKCPLK